MNIDFTWYVTALECAASLNGQPNVVCKAHWNVEGISDQINTYTTTTGETKQAPFFANVSGVEEIAYSNGQTFVPFENLTEAQVIAWIKDNMGPEKIANVEQQVSDAIQKQITPVVVVKDLPWKQKGN